MAGPNKRAKKPAEAAADNDYESDDSGSYQGQQEIQATFEGRNPEGQDFHGIKQLLQQLFLTTHIDLSQMSDMLISQPGIGSVLKQSCNDSDDEEDVEMVEESDVFGITSLINLTSHKATPCVTQFYQYINEQSNKHADATTQNKINQILTQCNRLAFLINERFVNIPSRISILMLSSLVDEVDRMKKKDASYNFEYYIMICKVWRDKNDKNADVVFSNDEEEIFLKKADCTFEYSVADQVDSGLSGQWKSEDIELVPHRKILLFKADQFHSILNEVKTFVQS